MRSNQILLEQAAADGSFEAANWPDVLQDILLRLDTIVENEFLRPTIPPSERPILTSQRMKLSQPSSQESQNADKENAPPQSSSGITSAPSQQDLDLPVSLQTLHQSIRKTLQINFQAQPPHTIQRLAELILRPKQHYRYLPQYLRAVDRVVQVQSDVTAYPLPFQTTAYVAGLPNGTGSTPGAHSVAAALPSPQPALGSDESLGGALLTPIPWLTRSPRPHDEDRRESLDSQEHHEHEIESTETNGDADLSLQSESTEIVEGPHGVGRIETVSVINGVVMTPSSTGTPLGLNRADSAEAAALSDDGEGGPQFTTSTREGGRNDLIEQELDEESIPHARGPEEIGIADTGPQDVPLGAAHELDLDAAAGRAKREKNEPPSGEATSLKAATGNAEVSMPDAETSTESTAAQAGSTEGSNDATPVEGQDTVMQDADSSAKSS